MVDFFDVNLIKLNGLEAVSPFFLKYFALNTLIL